MFDKVFSYLDVKNEGKVAVPGSDVTEANYGFQKKLWKDTLKQLLPVMYRHSNLNNEKLHKLNNYLTIRILYRKLFAPSTLTL